MRAMYGRIYKMVVRVKDVIAVGFGFKRDSENLLWLGSITDLILSC